MLIYTAIIITLYAIIRQPSFVIRCYLRLSSVLCYNLNMEKHSTYTPSRKKANEKYLSEKVDNILIRVPKGKKAEIQDAAKQKSVSLNQYIVDAIDNALNQDRENNV